MTEEEKKRLIDAVNSWGNNITEIYYKIGLPFLLLLKDSQAVVILFGIEVKENVKG